MAFKCDKCDASYPVRKSLLNHIRLKHGDAKQFTCQHCVYATANRSHYEQHLRSLHQGIKEICDICGRNFSDKSNLNKHVRQFHPELVQGIKRKAADPFPQPAKRVGNDAPKELTCGVCHAKFKEVFNLNKHMKMVHEEKSLKCNSCNHTSNNQFNIQRHKNSD